MSKGKNRLDKELVARQLARSRSQAENLINLGSVSVDGETISKPSYRVSEDNELTIKGDVSAVSRAGLKLASVARKLGVSFKDKVVLDVGSSTGGFTQYALNHGASKVYAVDVGTDQLHPSLRSETKIELREQTDIRDVKDLDPKPDVVVIDVSFISMREILPHIDQLVHNDTLVLAMLKPQFESGSSKKHKGVIKNDTMRRKILKDFEFWVKNHFVLLDKMDSEVSGKKGNQERFYLLKPNLR